ncbi:protein sprT [Lysinibacillus sphaericus]|nr:protein sprT [Lysinibacillus sphaericus]
MKTIITGEHYTFDNGNDMSKFIMFVTEKGKYMDEDVFYYDTVSLNPLTELLYETDLEESFFESKHVRLATNEEVMEIRGYCPIDVEWVENKMEQLIDTHWGLSDKPNVIFDPTEVLERPYNGVYDSTINTIIFRSELLSLIKDIKEIEKILLHELCHWYLFTIGENWRDKDVRFAKELIRVGAIETANIHNSEAKLAIDKALSEL